MKFIRLGHIETVELLLESGANIEIKTNDGKTVLILACEKRK